MSVRPTAWQGRVVFRTAAITAAMLSLAVPAGNAAATAVAAVARTPSVVAGTIETVAGGVGGPGIGTNVFLSNPCNVSFGGGHLYIDDTYGRHTFGRFISGAVRQVDPSSGRLTTPAGNHNLENYANGVPASSAFVPTCGTAVDNSGNLIISDFKDQRIRVVAASTGTFYGQPMTAGHIYSVAGDGAQGYSGDGGPATSAKLDLPEGVQVDPAGNIVFAEIADSRVRVVAASTGTFYGQPMTAGDIYTVAGNGKRGFGGNGGPATSATLYYPQGVALDTAGNLLIADEGNNRVRVVAEHTGTYYGRPMKAGNIYTLAGDGDGVYTGDGAPAFSSGLSVNQVAVDAAGNVLIADGDNNMVHVVAASTGTFYGQAMTAGFIYTIAGTGQAGPTGDGGPAISAELWHPAGVTVDGSGNVVIDDQQNLRVRVVAASTGTFYGQAMTAGDMYTIAGTGKSHGLSGVGGPATSAELPSPLGLTTDAAGNMVFADADRIQVKAARTGTFYGKKMTAGQLYTVAGSGVKTFSGDGGPALKAGMDPADVSVDGAGNLVIADTGDFRVRVVAASTGTYYGQPMAAGNIYTVAGDGSSAFSGDYGPATKAGLTCQHLGVDHNGNLLIADYGGNRIRVVAATSGTFYGIDMTAGYIYTVAGVGTRGFSGDGGAATRAKLAEPYGVTADAAGNLVLADLGNSRVRVVAEKTGTYYGRAMKTGDIYTVAGDGTAGSAGDGGPATSAELSAPAMAAVDAAGNLVLDDLGNSRIRVVAEKTGSYYGHAMTAGDIYTVAGNGKARFGGDGGPATKASLYHPQAVAVNPAGDLLISDTDNFRVRMVTG